VKPISYYRDRQRSPIFIGLLLFQLVLLLIQLWLFVSALEGILDGDLAMVIPAALVSLVCLAVNIWMLVGVNRMDRKQ
jgi:predicted Co/Zn/Cd cation transporter (cation efflux family)